MIKGTGAFTALFQLTGVGVVQTDLRSGGLVRANETFCELVGYSEAELQRMTYRDLTHPDDVERDTASFGALARGEIDRGASLTRCLRKDGAVVWLELHVTVLGEGDEALSITVVNDVTEQKRAAGAREVAEAEQRALLDSANQAVMLIAPDYTVRLFNRYAAATAARVFGREMQVGQSLLSYFSAEDQERFTGNFQEALDGREVRVERTLGVTSSTWEFFYYPTRLPGGEVVGVTFTSRDISERKRREANAAFLAEIAEDLSRLSSTDEITKTVGAKIGAYLKVTTCTFLDVDEARDEARDEELTVSSVWAKKGALETLGKFRIGDYLTPEFRRASRAGETTVICDTRTDSRTDARAYVELEIGAFVGVPFHRQGAWRCLLSVTDSEPRRWREDEIELFQELASRIFPRLERARAEDALRESEARYRTLFNSVDEGFCILEMLFGDAGEPVDYRFLEVNPAFERMTGLEGAVGKTALELVPKFERWWLETYGRVALTGEPVRFENRSEAMDRWFDVYASRVGGDESKVALVFNNVTERKKAEAERERLLGELKALNETLERRVEARTAELRRSERRFSQAFHAGPVAACITTLGRERFLEVNDAFSKLTGYRQEEVVGRDVFELGMWSPRENQAARERARRDGRGLRNLELSLRTKAGETRDIRLSGEVIELGSELGNLKLFYDVTERKRTETQLKEALEAVMADTAWFSRQVVERLAQLRSDRVDGAEVAALTKRERQVLACVAKGMSNGAIAKELNLAQQTVRNYLTGVYDKIGVRSRAEAVVWARERGLVRS